MCVRGKRQRGFRVNPVLTMISETPIHAPATTMGHFRPMRGTSIRLEAARVAVTPGRSVLV